MPDRQIETLVHVEMNDGAPSSLLRVFYAVPETQTSRSSSNSAAPSASVLTTVKGGVHHGLRAIWKHVALTMVDASQPTSHLSFFQSYQDLGSDAIQQRLLSDGKLPLHDELASKLVSAIMAAF